MPKVTGSRYLACSLGTGNKASIDDSFLFKLESVKELAWFHSDFPFVGTGTIVSQLSTFLDLGYNFFQAYLTSMRISQESNTMTGASAERPAYVFPHRRLKQVMSDPDKDPLVLVAFGAFSPITFLHLRMFEMACDYVKFNTGFEVVGSYLSPVGDAYKKAGLAPAQDRINMCELAVNNSANSLELDHWEAIQQEYQPTAIVLDHFEHHLNLIQGGVETVDGKRKPVRVGFLAGADLLDSMTTPGVWSEEDLNQILGDFPLFILERMGTDLGQTISQLARFKGTIHVIPQLIQNDVSSTKVRLLRRQGMSIRYLVPDPVVSYIEKHGLYKPEVVS